MVLPRRFCSLFCLVAAVFLTAFCYGQTSQGQWSSLQNWPTRAVHATLLPDGRVFFFSYYGESLNPNIWDPASNTFSPTAPSSYALFCAGHTSMADGRVFIAGGHIADYTGYSHAAIFDPFKNTLTQVPDMNEGRWYPTTTELANGDILVVSGDVNSNTVTDTLPQVYEVATNTWRNLTSAQLIQALYPLMFVAPNGKVIDAGPEPVSRYLDTTGTGAWTRLAARNFNAWRDYGPGVMYETGKILVVGGADPPTATAENIDLNIATPAWTLTGSMQFARRQHNAVVLPDGKVFIVGGSSGPGFDDYTNPVLPTEMWDPATGQFTVMPSIAVYRGYHSTAMLLPDGRVLSAGGNVGGANAQLYSPPYLFNGARPTISSVPTNVGYAQTVFVGTPDAASIAKIAFIRMPSVTHTFDESSRYMHLDFTQSTGGLKVITPASGNLAPPGYYMLFILNAAGVPSVAKIINIGQNGGTTGTATGVVTNSSGAPLANVSVSSGTVSATTTAPDGSYTLNNLPLDNVTVTAALSGYSSASAEIAITAGSTNNVPDLQLTPVEPGNITGNIVDSNGNAIQGGIVTAAGLTALTDGSGRYILNNVPGGSATVVASATGFSPATETVTVTTGITVQAPTMTLTSNLGNVTGKVLDIQNAPIAGATVTFGGGTATTDSTGSFSFSNIPAGTIQLVASATGFQSATQNVTIVGGNTATANFMLAVATNAPGIVTGTVTNIRTQAVIANAIVSWNTTSVRSNSSGVYSIPNVAGGNQTVTAAATGYLPVSSAVNVNGETSTLNFQLSTAGILNVTVVNSGTPVSGAQVTLSGGQIPTSLTGTTNASGVYASGWIPIGNYTITSGTGTATATVATGATTSITIPQNSGPTTGTITGTVTNISGSALSGATVSSGNISVTTQANGTYTLANVPAGMQTVTALLTGFQTGTQSVNVTAGGTSTANFSLTPSASTGTVTGKITNINTGGILSGATVKWGSMAVSTNTSGVYTISNVTSGNQTLTASATGYLPRNGSVNVIGGSTATLNIQLATAGIISVKAVNAAGAADPGASVTISGGIISTTVTGTTNSSGTFSSNWIPIGTYTVTISESGHTTQTQSATIKSGQTAVVNFTF